MKRLALVLAVAVLGTACGPNCPTGTTLVSWAGGFQGPAGQVNQSCTDARVTYVDVFVDDQPFSRSPCVDGGVGLPGVPTGGNILTVEGVDADGSTILFRDDFPFTQPGCDTVGLQALPGAGTVDLAYTFQAGSGAYCQSGSTFMWFTIFDVIANVVDPATIDGTSSLAAQRSFPCGPTDPVVTLPNGQYDLQAMNAMIENPATVFTSAGDTCRLPIPFAVSSGSQTGVAPTLADTSAVCL